jgi:DAK2 domain fusion protein YloV
MEVTSANLQMDGQLAKRLFGSGLAWLDRNKERVNQLNVFPVPDGDTGTNMYLTMRNAYSAIATMDDYHVGRMARALADGALRGARGNSGVILSQLWSGVAKALHDQPVLTAPLLADACQSAVEMAYRAVERPVEGTILTVSRSMMEAVIARYQHEPDLIALLKRMVFEGRKSLRHTPEMLPILKSAGVVDSGGQGLVFIFEGMLRSLCGRDVETDTIITAEQKWQDALVPDDELGYGYDVQFLMSGESLDIDQVRRDIAAMGWSTLVVGDNRLIKVHVHVHDPGEPISYAIKRGAQLDDIVVENMQQQYEQYVQTRAAHESGSAVADDTLAVITVANGRGMQRLFSEELGAAYVIAGGQTMNPSTGDFLKAIDALPNQDIILLPNNKNIILSAQQAASAADNKRVLVVPSITLPQGVSAMVEYANACIDGAGTLDDTAEAMTEALGHVITCEITTATRSVSIGDLEVKLGQYIGLIDDQLVTAGETLEEVARALLHKANAARYERITLYYGADIKEKEAQALADKLENEFSKLEFELMDGGQALYPYIISVE